MSPEINAENRVNRAINLEIPDRVPIYMSLSFFAARNAKITIENFMNNKDEYFEAMDKVYKDFGGWDAIWATGGLDYYNTAFLFAMKMKYPGRDLPADDIYQLVETPVMTEEDYDTILKKGWPAFTSEIMTRIRPDIFYGTEARARVKEARLKWASQLNKDISTWQQRGVVPLVGGFAGNPFANLSLMRSIEKFIIDLYRYPDKVLAALEAICQRVIETGLVQVKASGIKRIFFADTRSCAGMLSLKFFEKFSFPFIKKIVSAFAENDIISVLHFDQDWTRNLPYFLELPRKKCLLQLDGHTDIFKAKEVLGDHMCILGDVPASLLALGTPQEVEEYVRRLIGVVGKDGGFILGAGCEVPINAKEENLRAMIEAGRKYGSYT
jgi:uroporphyrinogen-III decarboxylase